MTIALYMDAHIPRAIPVGLRLREVDVLTAQEDNAAQLSDPALLDRATALRRPLFTFDDDLLVEAARRQREGETFAGVVFAHPSDVSIGTCVRDLELLAKAGTPEDVANRVTYLPL